MESGGICMILVNTMHNFLTWINQVYLPKVETKTASGRALYAPVLLSLSGIACLRSHCQKEVLYGSCQTGNRLVVILSAGYVPVAQLDRAALPKGKFGGSNSSRDATA